MAFKNYSGNSDLSLPRQQSESDLIDHQGGFEYDWDQERVSNPLLETYN